MRAGLIVALAFLPAACAGGVGGGALRQEWQSYERRDGAGGSGVWAVPGAVSFQFRVHAAVAASFSERASGIAGKTATPCRQRPLAPGSLKLRLDCRVKGLSI